MEENTQPVEAVEQEAPASAPEPSFSFVSDEEVAAMQQPQAPAVEEQTTVEATPEVQQEISQEPTEAQPEAQPEYAPEEIEGAVFNFLSERLGRDINSFDDLTAQQQEQRELDQRISVIADFVEKTGRDPRDWFVYQSMNPSEMDDVTAIQIQMSTEYPNLSSQEVNMLVSSKYKIDPDLHSEEEVQLSRLQMKIDAENARRGIDEMRLQYQAPLQEQSEQESLIDDNWVSNMRSELDAMDGIEFDLGNGSNFTFGIDGNYKNQLAEKNTRLDEFFDPYVREDGSWDYDMLNMHRAVIDNVDKIVQSVYKQGMADAQRTVVQNAANSTPTSPNQGSAPTQPDSLTQQLREALGANKSGFGFI
ncbi:MAG TPA: hypothetical protein DCL39_12830 [Alteromonas macleodii]|nr:hypothetical protein [Alteromonas macleodii]|tara:strand:+ start:42 stop:1127 length:1086 start_codon:yes stop_codon:yes gene_type:complete